MPDGLTLGFGLFTDRTPDDLSNAFLGARADFYGVTAGLELDDIYRLAGGARSESLIFGSTFALRYAYGVGDSAVLRVDPASTSPEPFRTVPGRFYVHELGLHVGSALHF